MHWIGCGSELGTRTRRGDRILGQWVSGLGWIGCSKMDPCSTRTYVICQT